MRVTLTKSNVAEHVYISKAYRNDKGKSTSKIFKKLGTMEALLPMHDNDRNKVLAWAKEQARLCTIEEKNNTLKLPFEFSQGKQIQLNKRSSFNGGYLFLKKIFYDLGLDTILFSMGFGVFVLTNCQRRLYHLLDTFALFCLTRLHYFA